MSIENLRAAMRRAEPGQDIVMEIREEEPVSIPVLSYAQNTRRMHAHLKELSNMFLPSGADFRNDRIRELYQITRDDREQMNEDMQSLVDSYAGEENGDEDLADEDEN